MFKSEELANHLKTSDTVQVESAVYAEWNMNQPDNIARLGNYRYRPTYTASQYYLLPMSYDSSDIGNYYTGATDADVAISSGFDDDDQPTLFISQKEKMKLLYSLEECIKPHRPRSGINKPLYLGSSGSSYESSQYITNPSPINKETGVQEVNQSYVVRRPRYYMSHKDDLFKYWTSYRTEYGLPTPRIGESDAATLRQVERGISFTDNNTHYIEDAVPFVVYKDRVPSNKIVIKVQTNVGDIDLGNLRYGDESIPDPMYGDLNKTTPTSWRIEKLNQDSSWEEIESFGANSSRDDGSAILGPDGILEVSYGLNVPEEYQEIFIFADTISSSTLLPSSAPEGYSYLVKETDHELGMMYVYINSLWESFAPDYSWKVSSEGINYNSKFVSNASNPDYFFDSNGVKKFREFEWIGGIRIVVQTMNKNNCTLDLIEFSPRLLVDISDSVSSFSITKTMSDLGNSSLPVSGLSVSTGSLEIFDVDFSFNQNNNFDFDLNTGSILSPYLDMPIKFLFYDITKNVNGTDYFIPVKSMYSESFPQVTGSAATVDIQLRDLFFLLESMPAPEILLTDISLSSAITVLLDFAGFSNYNFKRVAGYPEIIIPFFFVEPNQNIAEILQKLAVASQSAMFFDEYNNLIIMSKEYLLPNTEEERATDNTLYGQVEGDNLPNIINLSAQDKLVYNDGQVNYTTRYIQRSIGSTQTAQKIDQYKQFVYKPVLLWEVQGRESRQTLNQIGAQNAGYTLGAVPLNSDLSEDLPYVLGNIIYNDIIDVGENVYWIPSYSGYFYASGEIIRFESIEYAVSGQASPVWINNNQEYQNYMSALTFNGKMYPTGNVRIYTKPGYELVDGVSSMTDGVIVNNGRGQFGTPVASHNAGLINDNYWTNNDYVRGCIMDASKYLFTTGSYIDYPSGLSQGVAGKIKNEPYLDADILSQSSTRNGVIKNFLADRYATEEEINYYKTTGPGTVQTSALILKGPRFDESFAPSSFVSYIYKDFVDQDGQAVPYKHFGTRMRIIGKVESGTNNSQTPIGGYPMFEGVSGGHLYESSGSISQTSPEQQIKIYGGSGGVGFGINKTTNNGYFFEIVALTADNVDSYASNNSSGVKSANILISPAATCVANTVTVYTENQFDFQVGELVTVLGLVDANDPTNTRTPLNGEYSITAINTNKKSFQYVVSPSSPLTTTASTGGNASQSIAEYTNISNIYFYKVLSDGNGNAVPVKLWSGLGQINVDGGEFIGQNRLAGESSTTVYDLAAEYVNVGTARRFFLYLNGKQVATVDDTDPLPEYNNMAIFSRGSSRCMFENVYALASNYSENTTFTLDTGISKIFGDSEVDATEALRKYAISGMIQKTYLSGISSSAPPKYKIYFEEFGTILREMSHFNVKYDRAYPALYAKLMKILNRYQGYSVSGFYAGSYGADFLIFNCTDFLLNLDDTSGNYLRIQGIAFTQDTTYSLTVDDYYKKKSILKNTEVGSSSTILNPLRVLDEYDKIKNSRIKYGIKQFSAIDSPYIQSTDVAESIFGWVIDKVRSPKKSVGINTFATTNLQLGDILTIDYKDSQGDLIDIISPDNTRFVVYNMEYKKDDSGLTTTLYLVEV